MKVSSELRKAVEDMANAVSVEQDRQITKDRALLSEVTRFLSTDQQSDSKKSTNSQSKEKTSPSTGA